MRLGLRMGLNSKQGGGIIYPKFPAIAFFGDSITEQNAAAPALFLAKGYAQNARFRLNCAFEFVQKVTTAHSGGLNFNFGYGSYSASDLLNGRDGVYPMDDIAAANPSAVFVFAGSNPSEGTADDLIEIWDTFLADGRFVFAAEILPRHSTAVGYTAEKLAECYANNELLKAAAATRRIPFLEWASSITESPMGYGSLTYLPDAVHPGILGADVLGNQLSAFLTRYVGQQFSPPLDGSADWLTTNPYMSGNVSGGATGWTFGANITAKSKITDEDGTVWQRVTNADANLTLIRQTSGAGTWTIGDIVRPVMRVRAVSSGWNIKNIELRVVKIGSPNNTAASADMYIYGTSSLDSYPRQEMTGLMYGPPYEITSDATGMYTYIYTYGPGTYDFRQAGLIKVN